MARAMSLSVCIIDTFGSVRFIDGSYSENTAHRVLDCITIFFVWAEQSSTLKTAISHISESKRIEPCHNYPVLKLIHIGKEVAVLNDVPTMVALSTLSWGLLLRTNMTIAATQTTRNHEEVASR
jgi:hypothetical protein